MFNRLKEAWFEFKGIRSDTMGVLLRGMPVRTVAQQKYTRKSVSGRDGTLKVSGGEYTDSSIQLEIDVADEALLPKVLGWLTGSGDLRFSDEPGVIYTNATVDSNFQRKQIFPRATAQRFTVKWTADPFRSAYPEPDIIIIAQSGAGITNPGTAEALPRIKIIGSGAFSLTIGMQTMFFTDVTDGVIVDTLVGDVFTADGALLANDKASGALLRIQPGENTVQWMVGAEDSGGSVEHVEILPRWRYV